jgi:hypothetical protein
MLMAPATIVDCSTAVGFFLPWPSVFRFCQERRQVYLLLHHQRAAILRRAMQLGQRRPGTRRTDQRYDDAIFGQQLNKLPLDFVVSLTHVIRRSLDYETDKDGAI